MKVKCYLTGLALLIATNLSLHGGTGDEAEPADRKQEVVEQIRQYVCESITEIRQMTSSVFGGAGEGEVLAQIEDILPPWCSTGDVFFGKLRNGRRFVSVLFTCAEFHFMCVFWVTANPTVVARINLVEFDPLNIRILWTRNDAPPVRLE